jgi:hypothetical protein
MFPAAGRIFQQQTDQAARAISPPFCWPKHLADQVGSMMITGDNGLNPL